MSKKPTFYITTALPYVNGHPHIGHALEFVRADIVARYHELLGEEVFFNTGTDEHGQKIYQKSIEEGIGPQQYVDNSVKSFLELPGILHVRKDIHFIRTTDAYHIKAAQEFWKQCDANGYIYKKEYVIKYCVGCELEKTDSELIDGKCPDHPTLEIQHIEEENYFFRFSAFQEKLLALYKEQPTFVFPANRLGEIRSFVEGGLQDFSISRLKEKMSWGVEVPGDPDQVMYVWFDALVNYVSAVGWPTDMATFEKWWPVVQYAGKDNLRQQSAMWQAMLMSVGLPPSHQIVINGFVMSGGKKMSKTVGNVVDPVEVINEYGAEAFRYYIARELHSFEDSDFTYERFKESYNANLANGLGNLVSRTLKMATMYGVEVTLPTKNELFIREKLPTEYIDGFDSYDLVKSIDFIWKQVGELDQFIATTEPFKKIKVDEEGAKKDVGHLLTELWSIAVILEPFMPQTALRIQALITNKVVPDAPLFLRKD